MRTSVLIIVSLAVNLMLAALVFNKSRHHAATATEAASTSDAANAGDASGSAADAQNISTTATEVAITTVAGKFSWRDIEVQDLKDYLQRLRNVNCPEPTVQDLILAEINRRFAAKTRAFFNDPEMIDQNSYWKPYQRQRDPAKAKKNRERYKVYRQAQKEKTALIIDLFGFDVEKQRLKEDGYDPENNWTYATGELSFLPESKREAVSKYLEDWNEKQQDFYATIAGAWGPEERAKQKQMEAEKIAGLAQFLTPQEVREYELRNSQIAQQISSDLHGVDISREQYEALFDIRKRYGDSIYNYGDANNDEAARKQIEQNQKDMKAEVAAALGDQKFAELDRAQDYNYQQLKSLAKRNNLPADTANKVYDFKQAAEKAVADLNANTDLPADQRLAALQQIRSETEKSVLDALGKTNFNRYLKNGGWWMNQLSPKQ
jgi:hypothetical protein